MKLFPPLKQTSMGTSRDIGSLLSMLSQGFGENPQIYSRYVVPAPGGGTMPMLGHNGLDWPCITGTPVYASHDGVVSNQKDSDAGLGVVVTGNECKTIYWHLEYYGAVDNSHVKAGDLLGYSDNTGFSTGSHLHFGCKLLDGNGNVLNRDNGYDGCINPTSYLVWYDQTSMGQLTEIEVQAIQALEGYNDPTGAAYWGGVKDNVKQYLIARVQDKIKQLYAVLAKLQSE